MSRRALPGRDARPAPHRLRSSTTALLLAVSVVALSGCAVLDAIPGLRPGMPGPPDDGLPPLEIDPGGEIDRGREADAWDLLRAGRDTLDADPVAAAALAGRVVEDFPRTRSSGPALLLAARAAATLDRPAEADASLARYAALLEPRDPRTAEVRLLRAERLLAADSAGPALDTLVAFPPGADSSTVEAAVPLARAATGQTPDSALERIGAAVLERGVATPETAAPDTAAGATDTVPGAAEAGVGTTGAAPDAVDARLAAPVLLGWARRLALSGRDRAATRAAETALAAAEAVPAGTAEPELSGARELLDVLAGRALPSDGAARALLGALLPTSGPPELAAWAEAVREGIEVALATVPEGGIELAVRDDRARPDVAASRLVELAAGGGLAGIVGPLDPETVRAAAAARTSPVPLISPTAPGVGDLEAVYTLGGSDPGAARALARYAHASGLELVVVLHPEEPEFAAEAQAFREAFLELGGSVLRMLPYPADATFFEEQLRTARFLDPQALVLPIPPEDVPALAPQISYFGLDTLDIRVLGTNAWTNDRALAEVAARHLDGVVATTPTADSGESPGYRRFVEAYERHFRRTLRDPAAAYGWDATQLLLVALRGGARTPEEVRAALEAIDGFEGATGILSVEDGHIVRRHRLVCLQDRALRPVEPGEVARSWRPERRGDAALGEPETVPLGPTRVLCPGVPAPETAPGS